MDGERMNCVRCLYLEGRLLEARQEIRNLAAELELSEARRQNAEVVQVRAFGDSLEAGS